MPLFRLLLAATLLLLCVATARAAEPIAPDCTTACAPALCPDLCAVCAPTEPTACQPACEGSGGSGALDCPAVYSAGLVPRADWEADGITGFADLNGSVPTSCDPADDLSGTACVVFCGAICTRCMPGYAGADCSFSDAVTCNGQGLAQADGSCLCDFGTAGDACESCDLGFTGPGCIYSDTYTCFCSCLHFRQKDTFAYFKHRKIFCLHFFMALWQLHFFHGISWHFGNFTLSMVRQG